MAIVKRRREEPADARPNRPDTVIGLLYELSGDRDRCRRFVAMVSILVIAGCIGIALVVGVAMIAARGLSGSAPSYLLPAGFFSGASLLTWLTVMIKRRLAGSRADTANDGRQPGKH